MDAADIVIRLVVAGLAGAALGLEREFHGHVAGLRTHTLVALGACLFTVAGGFGFSDVENGVFDPSRVAAQVVSGIGFLGAGVIIRDGGTIRGVTTAATLWIAAALGLASAAGAFLATGVCLAMVTVVLALSPAMRTLQSALTGLGSQRIVIAYRAGFGTLGPALRILEANAVRLVSLAIEDEDEDDALSGIRRVTLRVRTRKGPVLRCAASEIEDRPEVLSVDVEPA